jgi:hypothetical protein
VEGEPHQGAGHLVRLRGRSVEQPQDLTQPERPGRSKGKASFVAFAFASLAQ